MRKERPLVEKLPYERDQHKMGRAIISPCAGCKNNTPVLLSAEDKQAITENNGTWPCPKQVLYAQAQKAKEVQDESLNYDAPIYDQKLKGVNPVWPGAPGYENKYAYVFLAFFEDNVDNQYNPDWDTSKIRCKGPYLLASTEKVWNMLGRIQQGDTVLGIDSYYFIDGIGFKGYAFEMTAWQNATGYTRKIDSNPGILLSGTPRTT